MHRKRYKMNIIYKKSSQKLNFGKYVYVFRYLID